MWKVEPSFDLPKDFELREDETFVHLLYRGQKIASFSHKTNPVEIQAVCSQFSNIPPAEKE